MAIYKTVGPCLQDADAYEEFAIDFLLGYAWCDDQDFCNGGRDQELNSFYIDAVETSGEITAYYDVRGNYYFFALN